MDDDRKYAYRFIIYWAMLEIRGLQSQTNHLIRLLNPITLHRVWRRTVRAGAVAEWLHNAAHFSTVEFEGFREDWFWSEHDRLVKSSGNETDYRAIFDACLKDAGRPVNDG